MSDNNKITLGISSCLVGNKVRYDGSHKRSPYCKEVLSELFEYQPFCPEMAAGLGTPRPTIRLIASDKGERLVAPKTGEDVTDRVEEAGGKYLNSLSGVSGYIFTHKSPSCGVFRTRIYDERGNAISHQSSGVFARQVMNAYPLLPVEEAERLNDPAIRENFLLRVYAYHQWKEIYVENIRKQDVINFYTNYKYALMATDQKSYKEIGRLLANCKHLTALELADEFIALFMNGMKKIATRKSHSNVLQHIQGYFKRKTDANDRQELSEIISAYRKGHVPLIAPVILIKHFLKKHPDSYLENQHYLEPYPDFLGLRSRI
jgi:uncharacterized protein YbgA (DUF1722 family)/uncharacterized protein YbbK (DUF523 family)